MKPVRQEDGLGCAAACVAFVLSISYYEAVDLFEEGRTRVKEKANFYCPEIVHILNSNGQSYSWKKLTKNQAFDDLSIVFTKRCTTHPYGHFLARYNHQWMDPWINLPNKNIEAGFTNMLPSQPTYLIYKTVTLSVR